MNATATATRREAASARRIANIVVLSVHGNNPTAMRAFQRAFDKLAPHEQRAYWAGCIERATRLSEVEHYQRMIQMSNDYE